MDFEYLNLKQSAEWAANYTNSDVTPSNISYLLQYGRLKKYGNARIVLVNKDELKTYYDSLIVKEIPLPTVSVEMGLITQSLTEWLTVTSKWTH